MEQWYGRRLDQIEKERLILYYCSDGTRVSEITIKKNLSASYKKTYWDGQPCCQGCGEPSQGSAHIIPKARLKVLHLTEMIWNPIMYFSACHKCNVAIENPGGQDWKHLDNISELLDVIEKYDPERYTKFTNNL